MHEVAVIGSGVAGLATVRTLQQAGYAPLVIAPAQDGTDNRGELLGPGALAPLTSLGWRELLDVDGVARPAEARFSAWGSSALVQLPGDATTGFGWHVDRTLLECAMLSSIGSAPMQRMSAAVLGVTRHEWGWTLSLSTGEEIDAKFLIDCSGRSATLTRRLGGERKRDSQLVAAYRTLPIHDASVMAATMVESALDGWWYSSPSPCQDLLFVACFTDADLLPSTMEAWEAALDTAPYTRARLESLGGDVGSSQIRTVVASTVTQGRVCGEGWAAAGDAAVALDPLAGHGLTVALWSATQVAAAARDWMQGDRSTLHDYQQAVTTGMHRFTADASRHYLAEQRFRNSEFWARRQARTSASPAGDD